MSDLATLRRLRSEIERPDFPTTFPGYSFQEELLWFFDAIEYCHLFLDDQEVPDCDVHQFQYALLERLKVLANRYKLTHAEQDVLEEKLSAIEEELANLKAVLAQAPALYHQTTLF